MKRPRTEFLAPKKIARRRIDGARTTRLPAEDLKIMHKQRMKQLTEGVQVYYILPNPPA
jgi:hypothetical protein